MRVNSSCGSLFTGRSAFRNAGANFRISRALSSRFRICSIDHEILPRHWLIHAGLCVRTSDSIDAVERTGWGDLSNLDHSRSTFSFNTRMRSTIERSRAVSDIMMVVLRWGVAGNVTRKPPGRQIQKGKQRCIEDTAETETSLKLQLNRESHDGSKGYKYKDERECRSK